MAGFLSLTALEERLGERCRSTVIKRQMSRDVLGLLRLVRIAWWSMHPAKTRAGLVSGSGAVMWLSRCCHVCDIIVFPLVKFSTSFVLFFFYISKDQQKHTTISTIKMLAILRQQSFAVRRTALVFVPRFYSAGPASKQPAAVVSSCPAGTVLKNLNIEKGQDSIVALADEEYPEWLWKVLEPKEVQAKRLVEENPIKAFKKQRRNENRKTIKEKNFLAGMTK